MEPIAQDYTRLHRTVGLPSSWCQQGGGALVVVVEGADSEPAVAVRLHVLDIAAASPREDVRASEAEGLATL